MQGQIVTGDELKEHERFRRLKDKNKSRDP
jgi:hypothetical protein